MATVTTAWPFRGISGTVCSHDGIYVKQDRRTGKTYLVKRCKPNREWTEQQVANRSDFSNIIKALSAWIKQEKVSDSADYQKVIRQYRRQRKYSTLRGMMYGRGMYSVSDDGAVTVDINGSTAAL